MQRWFSVWKSHNICNDLTKNSLILIALIQHEHNQTLDAGESLTAKSLEGVRYTFLQRFYATFA